MKPIKRMMQVLTVVTAGMVWQAGGCATTNQWHEFIRTEIAVLATQIVSDPLTQPFEDLTGPQVVEEVVPSL
ncbi:MAG: hypothetical protein HJJLKODD_00863 [Phycisphaerae bacterium]|nr:hypothetical protein [Phycisphaerae bacterium]